MFFTYLRRELIGRRKQTLIIAIGMALAIALVMIVNGFSTGVKNAQDQVLESVYGVGTDMTVSATPTESGEGGGPQDFEFDRGDGSTEDGTQTVSTSVLRSGPGSSTISADSLDAVLAVTGVENAAATLSLQNISFSGELASAQVTMGMTPPAPPGQESSGATAELNRGGVDGDGGSAFSIDNFSVLGVDPSQAVVGPLSTITLVDGLGLTATDVGTYNAVVDQTYATTAEIVVGDVIDIGGKNFTVVGIVANSTADTSTTANVYIPLDVAQALSGNEDAVTTIYVQATDSTQIAQVQAGIGTSLPDTTVKTQSDLASSVSGSLGTAAGLLDGLGLWLSVAVLAVAFLLAILFTTSGVTRRTREFGTLKAIGWSNGQIVRQVAGESMIQSMLGGVLGIVLGVSGIAILNAYGITMTGGASTGAGRMMQPPTTDSGDTTGIQGFGAGGTGGFSSNLSDIQLSLPITVTIVALAVGLAIAGGLLAGAIGGWRASRLSPATALRSVN